MKRTHLRYTLWVIAGGLALLGFTISIGHWQGRLMLPHNAMGWCMLVVIMLGQAGYWVGNTRPSDQDLTALRASVDQLTTTVTGQGERVEQLVAKCLMAEAYVDNLNGIGHAMNPRRDHRRN